jgi:dTMP kinase
LREPGGTPAGDILRDVLLDPESTLAPETEALLFAASRAQLVGQVIRPALSRGAVVLVDRFLLSTYAYQGSGRGLALESLRAANRLATGGLAPDLTLLLTLSLDEAMARMHSRGSADRMERESLAFHTRVGEAFLAAADPLWQLEYPEIGPVVPVSASGAPDDVTARCIAELARRWPARFATTHAAMAADFRHASADGVARG